MSLDTNISLVSVAKVEAYMGEELEKDVLWLYFSGTSGTNTVQVNDNSLVLIDEDNATTTFDLTNASYDTLTELVAAINAVTGWECGLIGAGAESSIDLVITGALNAEGEENKQVLKIKDNYMITELINSASDFINRYCNRTLKTTSYTLKRYDGDGAKLFLDDYPVTAIVQISDGKADAIQIKYTSSTAFNAYANVSATGVTLTVDGTSQDELTFSSYATLSDMVTAIAAKSGWSASIVNSDYNGYPSSQLFKKQNRFALNQYTYLEIPDDPLDDYDVDYDSGIIYLSSKFSNGFRNIFISYTAGYTTIPHALEQACIELVKYKYQKASKDDSLKSEKIGGVYSYTIQDLKDALPASLLAALDTFKRRGF